MPISEGREGGRARRLIAGVFALGLLLPLSAAAPAANAAPLENVSGIGPALLKCWHPPSAPDGSAVTLRFSFRRDGSLISAKVTYVGLDGGAELRRKFANSAIKAIGACTPLELAPRFAATIGGKVYVMQFSITRKQPKVRQMYA
jgi:hypothetical protein